MQVVSIIRKSRGKALLGSRNVGAVVRREMWLARELLERLPGNLLGCQTQEADKIVLRYRKEDNEILLLQGVEKATRLSESC